MPQAPVPYLNRALASEQLGVDAASSERQEEAQQHYKRAVAVSADQSAAALPAKKEDLPGWHSYIMATCSKSKGLCAGSLNGWSLHLAFLSLLCFYQRAVYFSAGCPQVPPCSQLCPRVICPGC